MTIPCRDHLTPTGAQEIAQSSGKSPALLLLKGPFVGLVPNHFHLHGGQGYWGHQPTTQSHHLEHNAAPPHPTIAEPEYV